MPLQPAPRPPSNAERGKKRVQRANHLARPDSRVADLAARAEGVLDLGELISCGLTRHGVRWRERNGRLHRVHDGVYAVGHPNISQKGRFIAAVKACQPGAALSHRSEAARLEIRELGMEDIEITTRAGTTKHHPGILAHRSAHMTRQDLMVRDGMLVTNATWTVVALAAVLPRRELRSAVKEALGMQIVSMRSLLGLLERLGPVRGSRVLRDILAHALPTRSELEEVVYDLMVSSGFVPPEVNEPLKLDGRTVIPDFRWPEQKLVLEADGARWHDNALARADDAERQALLERHGELVLRVRWDEATLRPSKTRARLEAAGAPRL